MSNEETKPTVKYRYSAPSNISFHGEIDSGFTRQELDELLDHERREVEAQMLFGLVDLYPIDDGRE